MPNYVITSKPGLLCDEKKDRIARQITDIHTEITGAPGYFAQVIFHDEPCRRYVNGVLADAQIWIRGDIRAGRPAELRSQLVERIMTGVARIAEVPETDVWVFLDNLESSDMSIYGQLLAEPGKEREWFASLPAEVQDRLSKAGQATLRNSASDNRN
ncbi:MAG: tautomerase family protein [Clostridiales bacterium]|nr:tautomerase family protein [Clostridiales bacterium]